MDNELEKLGLNDKEAKVYLACLELGEANVQRIAKKSGVKRTTIYDVLDSLKEKGLISSYTKNKRTAYFSQTPKKLEEDLEQKKSDLQKIMPELLSLANKIERKPKIMFFEGEEGIKEIYQDTLRYPGQEILAWVTGKAILNFDVKFLDDDYLPSRIQKKIPVRAIGPNTLEMQKYQAKDGASLRQTKLVKFRAFAMDVEINLYGERKIGIMAFEEKIGLIIESQKISNSLKSIFEISWNLLDQKQIDDSVKGEKEQPSDVIFNKEFLEGRD